MSAYDKDDLNRRSKEKLIEIIEELSAKAIIFLTSSTTATEALIEVCSAVGKHQIEKPKDSSVSARDLALYQAVEPHGRRIARQLQIVGHMAVPSSKPENLQ